jgi:hypothetical protein
MDSSRPRISQQALRYYSKHVLWSANWIFLDWKRVAITASCGRRRLLRFVLCMLMSLIVILASIRITLVVRLRARKSVSRLVRGVRRSGIVVRYVRCLCSKRNFAYAFSYLYRFVKSRLGPDTTSMNASYSKIRISRQSLAPYELHYN